VQADLTNWTPAPGRFDLVCAHYVHPAAPRKALFDRLAAWVAPGGTLLVVGHDPSDVQTTQSHAPAAGSHITGEDVVARLDPALWDIAVAETRSRTTNDPDGHEITMRDAVVRARKRP
jgi:hypothetical protein